MRTPEQQHPTNPVSVPLSCVEERLWRSLQRLLVTLPRALDEDLLRSTGLSLTQYTVLMHLSETDGAGLRMSDLATATGLSASRITRLVETLRAQGLVVKRPHSTDARGSMAVLTEAGRQRLRGACPAHLASARRRVMDQLDPALSTNWPRNCGRWPNRSRTGAGRATTPANRRPRTAKQSRDPSRTRLLRRNMAFFRPPSPSRRHPCSRATPSRCHRAAMRTSRPPRRGAVHRLAVLRAARRVPRPGAQPVPRVHGPGRSALPGRAGLVVPVHLRRQRPCPGARLGAGLPEEAGRGPPDARPRGPRQRRTDPRAGRPVRRVHVGRRAHPRRGHGDPGAAGGRPGGPLRPAHGRPAALPEPVRRRVRQTRRARAGHGRVRRPATRRRVDRHRRRPPVRRPGRGTGGPGSRAHRRRCPRLDVLRRHRRAASGRVAGRR
ncbi:DNA-binding transcriptional regulator, MarR family [Streptomyces sp. 3213]|nr:DNA-binding transcriptional regulator, MarR family [Streptomyces sp. 3213] [Streptomyces sp. 3213.3]